MSIVRHLSASLALVAPHHSLSLRDFTFRDIAIPVARFSELQPTKSRYRNPRVNPTTLVAWIYGPTPPELRTFQEYSPYLPCSFVRSNGSRGFTNSLQRTSTVRSFSENSSSCGTMSLFLPSTPSKVQILLNFPNFESFRKPLCTHSLQQTFKHFQVLESFNSAHTCSSSL
jgi:hypothetical protein